MKSISIACFITVIATMTAAQVGCPDDSILSQPPEGPHGSWQMTLSDHSADLFAFERFTDVDHPICGVEWWGFELSADTLTDCIKVSPFDVEFYQDDAGHPGDSVAVRTGMPQRNPTGYYYDSQELIQYSLSFPDCVDLEQGWISIRSQSDEIHPDCRFFWVSSSFGDGQALRSKPEGSPAELPTWEIGRTFSLNQHYAGTFTDPEAWIEGSADFSFTGCTATVTAVGIEDICGVPQSVYTLDLCGGCQSVITGHVTLHNMEEPLETDTHLTQIDVQATARVPTTDLNPRAIHLIIQARVELFLDDVWTDIGIVSLDMQAEGCPCISDFQWPLADGQAWNADTEFHITGTTIADLIIDGVLLYEEGTYDETIGINYDVSVEGMEPSLGCNAFRVESVDTFGTGNTMVSYFCENWGWYAEKTIDDMVYQNLFADELRWEVIGESVPLFSDTDYDLALCLTTVYPTATPTETPTSPPIPTPTATPLPVPATGTTGISIMVILFSGLFIHVMISRRRS